MVSTSSCLTFNSSALHLTYLAIHISNKKRLDKFLKDPRSDMKNL